MWLILFKQINEWRARNGGLTPKLKRYPSSKAYKLGKRAVLGFCGLKLSMISYPHFEPIYLMG